MEEIIETTPEGILEKVEEIVDTIVTLPNLSIQVNVIEERLVSMQNTLFWIGLVELLLVFAVIFLLIKHFKK